MPTLITEFKQRLGDEAGAVGCFVGIVRKTSESGSPVKTLHYKISDEAVQNLKKIAETAEKSKGISRVAIHHIVGDLVPGEETIYVLVAGGHRAEVFEALPQIMNKVRGEAQILEREVTETKSTDM